jgi:hypothetical protein
MTRARRGKYMKRITDPPVLGAGLAAGIGSFVAASVGLVTARKAPWYAWLLAAIAAVIAFIISAVAALREAKRIAKVPEFSLKLLEPREKEAVQGHEIEIRGHLTQREVSKHDAVSAVKNLKDRELSIVPFVKPTTGKHKWYAQKPTRIEPDGKIIGKVRIGEPNRGAKTWFKIVLVVLEEGRVPEDDEQYEKIPESNYGISKRYAIYRER